ncbi:MAG TPA: putative sulfate exporter family transporter [Candidatus Paceibacterota bacterium]|nr:putative sulfate exporter family transporter [Candidatus Paceibacterota bacterium]
MRVFPGVALMFGIGILGKLIEQSIDVIGKAHGWHLPKIEYVLWAILLGLLIRNLRVVPRMCDPGIATYDFWLKAGIVLLGTRFLLGDIAKLGPLVLALVVIEILFSIAVMTLIGRWFGLGGKLTSLLAVGSGICGVSAIIATEGAIEAEEKDAALAIAVILAVGAVALFLFPFFGHVLHMPDQWFGVWAGLAVDNTAEATAAGAIFSDAAAKTAVLVKTTRNAMIGFVVLAYAVYWANKGMAKRIERRGRFLWEKFPKFVLGFLAVSVAASAHAFSKGELASLANLSRWAFLITFAGVGLRTDIRAMMKQGTRPLLVGLLGELLIAASTLTMVAVASAFA